MRTYMCDRCGKEVEKSSDLHIVRLGPSIEQYDRATYKPFFSGDLCTECCDILHKMRVTATANAEWRFSLMQNSIKEEYI